MTSKIPTILSISSSDMEQILEKLSLSTFILQQPIAQSIRLTMNEQEREHLGSSDRLSPAHRCAVLETETGLAFAPR